MNQRLISAMLGALGITPQIVGDGEAAVAAAERGGFDLILMDVSMPVLDGLSAIRRIRAQERQAGRSRTPIHVVSSQDGLRDLWAARAAGADGHLAKPIAVSVFLETVQSAVQVRTTSMAA